MRASFEVFLSPKSYIYIYFDRSNEEKSYGVRLSKNKMFPSIYFIRNGKGKFLHKEVIVWDNSASDHEIEIVYNNPAVFINVNGKEILAKRDLLEIFDEGIEIAWGGSSENTPVWIDNIKILNSDDTLIYDSKFGKFEGGIDWYKLLVITFCFGIYVLGLRTFQNRRTEILINFYLLIFFTIIYFSYYYVFSGRYFNERGLQDEDIRRNFLALKKKYKDALNDQNRKKVVFYGGSKTEGIGARFESEIWVNIVKENLSSGLENFNQFSFFNWGISSAASRHFVEFNNELIKSKPSMIIILMGINEHDHDLIKKNIKKILSLNKISGVRTLILKESFYSNNQKSIKEDYSYRNFMSLNPLCNNLTVICVDINEEIYNMKNPLYDTGIRWVEYVHNNSYGQELFGSAVTPYILKELKKNKMICHLVLYVPS